jgi:hypothetical protein
VSYAEIQIYAIPEANANKRSNLFHHLRFS